MDEKIIPKKIEDRLSIPMAIIVAGALIAGALYFSSISRPSVAPNANTGNKANSSLENVRPVSATDHIRGDINAPVIIVEYSDTECPFCQRFHKTMQRITADYGNKVAWVYRHYPIDSLHPKARNEAVALECANLLGGNNAFWKYTDRLYEITPSNNGLDASLLPEIAVFAGLDRQAFTSCMATNDFEEIINADIQNAVAIGGTGTPWSVVIGKDGQKYDIQGAQPYEVVKQIIDLALE